MAEEEGASAHHAEHDGSAGAQLETNEPSSHSPAEWEGEDSLLGGNALDLAAMLEVR